MKTDVLLLALAVTFAFVQILPHANCCSCLWSHPQTQFCRSDFVILARVKRERILNTTKVYKVRVKKEYKISDKGMMALKSGRLITASEPSMCGVSLEIGKLYAISGSINSLRAQINLCGMATLWRDLTKRQRKGLKSIYKNGCDCRIDNCKYRKCRTKSPDACMLTNSCQAEEGICLRQKNKKCMWTRNRALYGCLKQPSPLTISRWSG